MLPTSVGNKATLQGNQKSPCVANLNVEGGSILMFQTILAVNPIRKAVVADRHNYADRHNPITYVMLQDSEKFKLSNSRK